MLGFSQTTGYAIQALICIASEECQNVSTADIANCSKVPRPYLCKIVNSLTHKGLLIARRGVKGGIKLARPAEEITLLEIIEAIEGKNWASECLLNLNACAELDHCPTRELWHDTKEKIREKLQHTTLADIVKPRRKCSC